MHIYKKKCRDGLSLDRKLPLCKLEEFVVDNYKILQSIIKYCKII